jgi:sarcosine oxidase, subunit alpha
MHKRLSPVIGEWIRRDKEIHFKFEGKLYRGFEGDSITSALWASGEQMLGRSFKYHRPRGILSLANHDINILMQGGLDTHIRADITLVNENMVLETINTGGDVKTDNKRWLDWLSPILPVGFYYKAFFKPRWMFPFWENVIRKSAGLGEINFDYPKTDLVKLNRHCDVLIIGAGTSGLSAAIQVAEAGFSVVIVDENTQAGGSLGYDRAGENTSQHLLTDLLNKITKHPRIQLYTQAYAAGYYTDHLIPIITSKGMLKMRAKSVIVATGVFEQPPVFRNNDLPGIMLGSAAQRLLYRYSIKPFDNGVVFTANGHGYRTALDLIARGIKISTIVDLRHEVNDINASMLRDSGVTLLTGHCVYEAIPSADKTGVQAVWVCPYDETSQQADTTNLSRIECNGVAMSAGWAPAAALLYQAGTRMRYDNAIQQFRPQHLPDGVFAAGKVNGFFELQARISDGKRAAAEAIRFLGKASAVEAAIESLTESPSHPYPMISHPKGKNFIDFDEDIQLKDFINAAQEGFNNIELMKRFTTFGMGPSQGKHANMNAIRILAKIRNLPVEKVGSTTARPFYHPTPIGHLAGRSFHPERRSPIHDWHQAQSAEFTTVGVWQRPAYYQHSQMDKFACIQQEVRAVRQCVGLFDASTLGKIEVFGKEAALFLERFYTGEFANMRIGRTRYALAVDEAGVIFDDGVIGRLSEQHFYVTASTSNAASVYREMQRWQQIWQLDIALVNVTSAFAAFNLVGPMAYQTLSTLLNEPFTNDRFPFGEIQELELLGVKIKAMRLGFVSKDGYELHVPATDALTVWKTLMHAGEPHGIKAFGTEAQRILRLEMGHLICGHDTDGLTNPYEAGLEFALAMDKPFFIGQRSLHILSKKPLSKRLVAFELDPKTSIVPNECNLVIDQMDIAGRLTSISYSPSLNKTIGLAYVGQHLSEAGHSFQIRTDKGFLVTASVCNLPFIEMQQVS